MTILGKYIAEHRLARNISIRKLAELANLSHTEIYRLEHGDRKHPSPNVLKSIALALNLDFNEIMSVAGYIEDLPQSSKSPLLNLNIDDLNEQEIEELINFIRYLRFKRLENRN